MLVVELRELKHFQTLFQAQRGLNGFIRSKPPEMTGQPHISLMCLIIFFGAFQSGDMRQPWRQPCRGALVVWG